MEGYRFAEIERVSVTSEDGRFEAKATVDGGRTVFACGDEGFAIPTEHLKAFAELARRVANGSAASTVNLTPESEPAPQGATGAEQDAAAAATIQQRRSVVQAGITG